MQAGVVPVAYSNVAVEILADVEGLVFGRPWRIRAADQRINLDGRIDRARG
jgi:hypothetical protein